MAFDKARGAGGRLSTRRAGEQRFDHGAQYFTVRDPGLARRSTRWLEAGAIAVWDGPFGSLGADGFVSHEPSTPRYVGLPGMSGMVKELLRDVQVQFGQRITAITKSGGEWVLHGEEGTLATSAQLVVATPAPQAVPLLGGHRFAAALGGVEYAPCWTTMLTVRGATVRWGGLRVEGSPLSWIARNQTKPGRGGAEQWVLQASPEWSCKHLEKSQAYVGAALRAALCALPGLETLEAQTVSSHRWRFALVTKPVGVPCLHDHTRGLTVCGDGLLGGRVESAMLTGLAAAEAVAQASRV